MTTFVRKWSGALALTAATVLVVTGAWVLQTSPQAPQWLWNASDRGAWLLPLIATAALIDSINPCAVSILLVTLAFLFGLGRMRRNVLAIGGLYIAGVFAVYLAIGLGLLQALHLFDTPHFMALVGAGALLVGGALSVAGELVPAFPVRLRIPAAAHHQIARLMGRATLAVAFPLGVLVGLCEFPCTGGPYLMAVGLLHDEATRAAGVGYLLLYNAIFVLPLVLILLVAANGALLETLRGWHATHKRRVRLWGGAAMIAFALLILAW